MPRKRRVAKLQEQAPPIRVFRSGAGDEPAFSGDPHYASRAAAAKAWPKRRAEAWAGHDRGDIPVAARAFDSLRFEAIGEYRAELVGDRYWLHVHQALEDDRAALAAFRARDPKGAKSIGKYLAALEADFDALEALLEAREHDGGTRRTFVEYIVELGQRISGTYDDDTRRSALREETVSA